MVGAVGFLLLAIKGVSADNHSDDPFSGASIDNTNPSPPPYPKLDAALNKLVTSGSSVPDESYVQTLVETQHYSGKAVLVEVILNHENPAIQTYIDASGGRIAHSYTDLIEAYVPTSALSPLSKFEGVRFIYASTPPTTHIIGEGPTSHNADEWHALGFTGEGVKVGVIDGGFEGIVSLQGTELPISISARCYYEAGFFSTVTGDCENGEVHGTAVSEAVLDMAPDVSLYISSVVSSGDVKSTVDWMVSEGVDIINMSLGWSWTGQGDGESVITNSTLNSVKSAVDNGIVWANAAGNERKETWNGAWRDPGSTGFHQPECGSEGVIPIVAVGWTTLEFDLRWADDWSSPKTDLDLYVYYLLGSSWVLYDYSTDDQSTGAYPRESVSTATIPGYYGMRAQHVSGVIPDNLEFHSWSGQDLYYASCMIGGSIGEPADSSSPGMLAVGASPFYSPTSIESYSSRGPTRDGRTKPDIVAVDRANSVSYGYGGFTGTSQASPHLAGMAALVLEQFPSYTPSQVKSYLTDNALGQGTVPNNTWGYGLAFLPNNLPDPPTSVTATAGQGQATVAWTAPSSDGGSPITSYVVISTPGSVTTTVNGTETTAIISGLTAGTTYTFIVKATNANGTSEDSDPSNAVMPYGSAYALEYTAQPSGATAGSPLTIQPVIRVTDSLGNTVTSSTGTITLTITSGTGKSGASLLGTTAISAASGIATFNNIQIDGAEQGYTLTGIASGLIGTTSEPFNVSTASPSTLTFTKHPSVPYAIQPFATQPIIKVTDDYGNLTPEAHGTFVTVSITSGTGGIGATLGGTTSMLLNDGVAAFSDLTIDKYGPNYRLTASSQEYNDTTSILFNVYVSGYAPAFSTSVFWSLFGTYVVLFLIFMRKKGTSPGKTRLSSQDRFQ